MGASIKGLEDVVKNLNQQLSKVKKGSEKGLLKVGLQIKAKAVPLTPVVTSNLRASCFVLSASIGKVTFSFLGEQLSRKKFLELKEAADATLNEAQNLVSNGGIRVVVGYAAQYAWAVHENPMAGKTGKPGASTVGQWKFLETAITDIQKEALDIMYKEARI